MRLGWKIKVGSFFFVLRNAAESREIEVFGTSRTKILLERHLAITSHFLLVHQLLSFI